MKSSSTYVDNIYPLEIHLKLKQKLNANKSQKYYQPTKKKKIIKTKPQHS